MNKTLILTILLGAAALAGVLYATKGQQTSFLRVGDYKYKNEYLQFKNTYQKQYGTDEGFFRYQQYEINMDIIAAHNTEYKNGKTTYFLGENVLTDLSLPEYKAKYLGYQSKQMKTLKTIVVSDANVTAAPSTIDWTTKGAVNPVKDQGQCGSCWAFSAVNALESLYFNTNGKLEILSEQSLVDCSGKYGNAGCNGGLMDQAFQFVSEKGIASSASYKYTAKDGKCQKYTSVFQNKGFHDVTPKSDSALQAAVAQGTVSVAIQADTSAFQLYAGGILNDTACGTTLDHGVAVVGYGTDFWKVRNSWGASWGEQGYIRLARTGNDAGMCGIQLDASYPTA